MNVLIRASRRGRIQDQRALKTGTEYCTDGTGQSRQRTRRPRRPGRIMAARAGGSGGLPAGGGAPASIMGCADTIPEKDRAGRWCGSRPGGESGGLPRAGFQGGPQALDLRLEGRYPVQRHLAQHGQGPLVALRVGGVPARLAVALTADRPLRVQVPVIAVRMRVLRGYAADSVDGLAVLRCHVHSAMSKYLNFVTVCNVTALLTVCQRLVRPHPRLPCRDRQGAPERDGLPQDASLKGCAAVGTTLLLPLRSTLLYYHLLRPPRPPPPS